MRSNLRRLVVSVYHLLRQKDPPHRIALGLALGIFVGMLPIMGIQMVVVSILALPLRGNLKAAIAGVWISNPVTFIPMYYANYRFGLLFLSAKETSRHAFGEALEAASPWDWSDVLTSFLEIFDLGVDILVPLWLGSGILGVALGAATYLATHRAIVKYRERRG